MRKITSIVALLISAVSFAQIALTSFEEPAAFSGPYTDTGDASVAHDLINNPNEPLVDYTASNIELGFNASYIPYDTPGEGLTDGDFVGVTDSKPTSSDPYTDGVQGYKISDVDGNYILTFDAVDLAGVGSPSISLDYFIAETGYEGNGTVNSSGSDRLRIYIMDLTNSTEIDILNTEGSDINDLGIEGSWITGSVNLATNTNVQLIIEGRTNAGPEAFFFDNIVFAGTLGSSQQTLDQFAMYPNPATKGYVNITSRVSGAKNVSIFDVLGKQVIKTTLVDDRLDISKLNSGVYILKIEQEKTSTTKKLVVN
ncbi:T9SS type A sorting domain-containing protein [Aequorivita lipolytica]|uniref:T9SS type A sorting domain-containing protein n=1 Tax=Aequorivita lipolytica TaxID=153267 RepID=A0A5C6YPA2_9FLAO|nr:T9SS type A sorting domain-containing protein [Aequorivita lipolytica]TXD69289.1 T9SS type A sorting domain-containing protein [Aequorivita lipolytica]SRX50089.1 hypothetical protein AEQU2_00555 [Aequorivita lipolytica]